MAQEVSLMGATYSDVPSILLPDSSNTFHSFVDTSDATASASTILSGYTAYVGGELVTGTASGGGSSSWTKVAETSYTVSTTSTSATTVATWETGDSSIWTSDSFVYVRIRDTSGARSGYFYGSDTFIVNYLPANGSSTTSLTAGTFGMTYRYSSSGYASRYNFVTTGYGVFADMIYSDGRIRIRSRYHSTYAPIIDGTYSVECYLLTPPSAIFG